MLLHVWRHGGTKGIEPFRRPDSGLTGVRGSPTRGARGGTGRWATRGARRRATRGSGGRTIRGRRLPVGRRGGLAVGRRGGLWLPVGGRNGLAVGGGLLGRWSPPAGRRCSALCRARRRHRGTACRAELCCRVVRSATPGARNHQPPPKLGSGGFSSRGRARAYLTHRARSSPTDALHPPSLARESARQPDFGPWRDH